MPLLDDDVVQLLGRLPPLIEAAPEAAVNEAAVIVKRGQNSEKEPDGSERLALKQYVDALDLDPGCRSAYEAIGRLLLSQKGLGKPAVEVAVHYFEAAQKKFPGDQPIQDISKRICAFHSPQAAIEPALAKSTGRMTPVKPATPPSGRAPKAGPTRKCQYCGSPIPAGAEQCKSCQMSGEIVKPDLVQMMKVHLKQKSSHRLLWFLILAVLVVGGTIGTIVYVRLHR